MEQPIITDKPIESVLPPQEDLSASEYRAHRDGKPIAEIVSAREPALEPTLPDIADRPRDEQGKFIAQPASEPAKAGKPPAENPRHDPRAKIDELTKHWRATERERDDARAEIARLTALQAAPSSSPAADPRPVPSPEKFTFRDYDAEKDASYEAYIEDRAVARIRHENALEAKQATETQTKSARETALRTFHERHATFVAAHPDFHDLVKTSPIATIVPPLWVNEVIIESEHGPLLQYHLLQHPDAFHAIVKLPERAAVKALGILEARLTAASTGPAADVKPQTQAEAPLEPVGASASTASSRSLETVATHGSAKDFRRLRESGVKA